MENPVYLAKIASSVSAEVYSAKAPWLTPDIVAIKTAKIPPEKKPHDQAERLINHEIGILSKLAHPNIVKYYGSCLFVTRPSIVMELMAYSLDHVLTQTTLLNDNEDELASVRHLNIVLGIASALKYLHDIFHVHQDVKPTNILLDETCGNAKLCDFGFTVDLSKVMYDFKWEKGSLCWLAPEVVNNETPEYPDEADMWALGQVALQLYTHPNNKNKEGQIVAEPYVLSVPKRNMTKIQEKISKGETDPIPTGKPLTHLISWCLIKDPAERADASEAVSICRNLAKKSN